MTRLSRCCCRAIRKRRPGGYGPTFVTTVTPGQRWRRRCGSLTARTEKGIHPQTHLAGFSGVLQADAYAGFNELYRDGRITEAACWAHARRKIHDVHVRTPVSPDGGSAETDRRTVRHRGRDKGNDGGAAPCRTSVENETAAEIPRKAGCVKR